MPFNYSLGLSKFFAFTLAEVLITLGIIGIVAAMTMPALIAQNEAKANTAKLKKFNSIMNQAFLMAVKDNGTPDIWGFKGSSVSDDTTPEEEEQIRQSKDIIVNTFSKYLKTIYICKYTESCKKAESYRYERYSMDGTSYSYWDDPSMVLADGTYILAAYLYNSDCKAVRGPSKQLQNICGEFFVDINGKKRPNATGRDIFLFYITKYGIVPVGTERETIYTFDNYCNMSKKHQFNGYGCAGWVVYNENMDYLKCSGLSWNGKSKCK